MFYNFTDINVFNANFPNGIGVADFQGWFWENGANGTVDTRGKFPVFFNEADTDYDAIYKTGGSKSTTLTTNELPVHSHVLTDPGHVHTITDVSHDHVFVGNNHTHTATDAGHTHTGTVGSAGAHTHTVPISNPGISGANRYELSGDFGDGEQITSSNGDHYHGLTVNSDQANVSIGASPISGTVQGRLTGITGTNSANTGVTMASTGSGQPFENRPPFTVKASIIKLS